MRIVPTLAAVAVATTLALTGCTTSTPTTPAPTRESSTTAPIARPTATPTPTPTPSTTPAPVAAPLDTITAPTCQEDEPCWDCTTMGNLTCGQTAEPLANSAANTPAIAVPQPVAAPVPAPQPVKVQTPTPAATKPVQTQPAPSLAPLTYEQRVALCGKIAAPEKSPYCVDIKDTRIDTPAIRQDALANLAIGWTTDLTSVELRETFRDTYLRSDSAAPATQPGTIIVKSAMTPNVWHTFKLNRDTAFKQH